MRNLIALGLGLAQHNNQRRMRHDPQNEQKEHTAHNTSAHNTQRTDEHKWHNITHTDLHNNDNLREPMYIASHRNQESLAKSTPMNCPKISGLKIVENQQNQQKSGQNSSTKYFRFFCVYYFLYSLLQGLQRSGAALHTGDTPTKQEPTTLHTAVAAKQQQTPVTSHTAHTKQLQTSHPLHKLCG